MNAVEYIESVRNRLQTDSIVLWFDTLAERANENEGYFRARVYLHDGSVMDFSEYVIPTENEAIALVSYRYHWQNKDGKLIRRWDNAPHFQKLSNFPHHIHNSIGETGEEIIPGELTNIFAILDSITSIIENS